MSNDTQEPEFKRVYRAIVSSLEVSSCFVNNLDFRTALSVIVVPETIV